MAARAGTFGEPESGCTLAVDTISGWAGTACCVGLGSPGGAPLSPEAQAARRNAATIPAMDKRRPRNTGRWSPGSSGSALAVAAVYDFVDRIAEGALVLKSHLPREELVAMGANPVQLN